MSSKDKPRSDSSVYTLEVLFEGTVLFGTLSEVMFGAHYNKVDLSMAEAEPVAMETQCHDTRSASIEKSESLTHSPGFVKGRSWHEESTIVRHSTLSSRSRIIEQSRTVKKKGVCWLIFEKLYRKL